MARFEFSAGEAGRRFWLITAAGISLVLVVSGLGAAYCWTTGPTDPALSAVNRTNFSVVLPDSAFLIEASLVGALSGVCTYILFATATRTLARRKTDTQVAPASIAPDEQFKADDIYWEVKRVSAAIDTLAERLEAVASIVAGRQSISTSIEREGNADVPRSSKTRVSQPERVSAPQVSNESWLPRNIIVGPNRPVTPPEPEVNQPSPALVLAEAYLRSCCVSSGGQFEHELGDEIRRAGSSAEIRYVYRDAAHEGGDFTEDQANLGSVYLQQSIRVTMDGLNFLVPQPQRDSNFNDLTGYERTPSDRLLAKVGNLRAIEPAQLEPLDTLRWRVTKRGRLTFSA